MEGRREGLVGLIKEHGRWVEKSEEEEKPAEKEVVNAKMKEGGREGGRGGMGWRS